MTRLCIGMYGHNNNRNINQSYLSERLYLIVSDNVVTVNACCSHLAENTFTNHLALIELLNVCFVLENNYLGTSSGIHLYLLPSGNVTLKRSYHDKEFVLFYLIKLF